MVRIMCSRILKFSKPYIWWARHSSSRCFNSRAYSHHNLITKMMITSSLQNLVQSRTVSSHAQIANDHQSVTIETFDALYKQGNVREATKVVDILEEKGHVVDLHRLLGLAKLCGEAEALEEARVVHDYITAYSPLDVRFYDMIIEMYSSCGSIDDALNVFDEMPVRSSETWCVMMRCLTKNGEGELAIDMFTRFKAEGNKPDKEIFKAVFSACAWLGDSSEGLLHFQSMYRDYGIIPSMEHYVSVTEMLAACGHLDEALEFVERMTVEPSIEVWETLMNLSWVHGDIELGDRFAELVKKLDATRMNKESNAGLVAAKTSDSAKEKLKKMMREGREAREERNHHFSAGDTSHPESDRIFATLRRLKMHMLEMGFVPATRVCLVKVDDEEDKEEQLLFRSSKLAVAHGLRNSDARSHITVMQNMRICIDGHNTLKMISIITGREITQRDVKRFHQYKNGVCICKDHW